MLLQIALHTVCMKDAIIFLNISLISHNVLKMMMNIAKDCMILAHIRPSGAEDAFTHALEAGRFC